MILHIALDEKFIDGAYSIFEEAAPRTNHFVVISECKQLKFVKSAQVSVLKPEEILEADFLKDLANYCFVVLHSLAEFFMPLVLKAPKITKFLWVGWGYDYYSRFRGGDQAFFLPKTRILYLKNQSVFQLFWAKIVSLKCLIIRSSRMFHECLRRIDYFAPVLPNEYDLCKANFKSLRAKFVSWNAGSFADTISSLDLKIDEDNFLLGNSASYTNNHIEAMDVLSGKKNWGKVITPLNYGDIRYQSEIVAYGKLMLGDNFKPLLVFMPAQEYFKVLSSCRYVVMNHLRQQGMGSILASLFLGSSIFLHSKNPVYGFLTNIGAHVFVLSQLENMADLPSFRLSKEQIEENRSLIDKMWGRSRSIERTKYLIKRISSGS